MTMREEIIERIDHMTETTLERLKKVIDTDPAFKYPDLPDVRVQRTQADKDEFKRIVRELAEPITGEPPFELEPSWFRMPRNETQLQSMIEMARANFDTESEP